MPKKQIMTSNVDQHTSPEGLSVSAKWRACIKGGEGSYQKKPKNDPKMIQKWPKVTIFEVTVWTAFYGHKIEGIREGWHRHNQKPLKYRPKKSKNAIFCHWNTYYMIPKALFKLYWKH